MFLFFDFFDFFQFYSQEVQQDNSIQHQNNINTLELQHQKVSSDLLSLKKKHEILINSPIMNIQTPIFETNMITEYSNIIHRIRNECSILRSQLNTTTNGLSTVRRSSLLLQKELQKLKNVHLNLENEFNAFQLQKSTNKTQYELNTSKLNNEIQQLRSSLTDTTQQLVDETRARAKDVQLSERKRTTPSPSRSSSSFSPSRSSSSSSPSRLFTSPGHSDFHLLKEAARFRAMERESRKEKLFLLQSRLDISEDLLNQEVVASSIGSPGGSTKMTRNELENDIMDAERLANNATRRIESIQNQVDSASDNLFKISVAGKSARKGKKKKYKHHKVESIVL